MPLLYFKTFQVYSSYIFVYLSIPLFSISKLFKFTVHEVDVEAQRLAWLISKLFKFTVHVSELKQAKNLLEFQNFSSLQFIL